MTWTNITEVENSQLSFVCEGFSYLFLHGNTPVPSLLRLGDEAQQETEAPDSKHKKGKERGEQSVERRRCIATTS